MGFVKNGVIVPDSGINLPEGTRVEFSAEVSETDRKPTLGEAITKFAGSIEGYPADLSKNHDHYLYGTPKND